MRRVIGAAIASVLMGTSAFAQQVQSSIRVAPVPGLEVLRTPDGDYEIRYLVGNEKRSFVFVPATKVEPLIESTVLRMPDGTFIYDYRLSNLSGARQDLFSVRMSLSYFRDPLIEAPAGWQTMATESTQRLLWFKVPVLGSPLRDGIRAGERAGGFRIRSVLLPAPQQVACQGAAPDVSYPDDLSLHALQRLQQTLVTRNYTQAWAMTPRIPTGEGEPELTPAVFAARISMAYSHALETSTHPGRAEILAALAEAIEVLGPNPRQGVAALRRARSLAGDAVTDGWAASLGRGIVLCIDYLVEKFGLGGHS